MLQALQPDDMSRVLNFAIDIVKCRDSDADYLQHIHYSEEATFHLFADVNRLNMRIWRSENRHHAVEIIQKLTCGLMSNSIFNSFFFRCTDSHKGVYLDMTQLFTFPEFSHLQTNMFIIQVVLFVYFLQNIYTIQ